MRIKVLSALKLFKPEQLLFCIAAFVTLSSGDNPVIRHLYTADPAAMVHNDTFFLYTGHDEGDTSFVMNDWYVFSSTDMVNWTDHGPAMTYSTFSWASGSAWAGQCIERNGKFYWYQTVYHKSIAGFAIGVAVSDNPTGPFTDARGSALITNAMTTDIDSYWDDIDPTVFIDDNDQAYLVWGNTSCKVAKLKSNMTEIDGSISVVTPTYFTEAPWLHKYNGTYYLSYAALYPEYIDYATSTSPLGPWTSHGRLNELITNCETNHQAIVEFKSKWYFVYHSAGLYGGKGVHRSVCIDELTYNADGTIKPIVMTTTGVAPVGTAPMKSGTRYQIQSRLSGKVLEIPNGSTASGTKVKQKNRTTGADYQLWTIDSVGYGVYKIINAKTGYSLEVANSSYDNVALIQQASYSGTNAQKWKLVGTTDGYQAIVNVNSGKAIDIMNLSSDDTASIIQYEYWRSNNQQWKLVEDNTTGIGTHQIQFRNSAQQLTWAVKSSGRAKSLTFSSAGCSLDAEVSLTSLSGKLVFSGKTAVDNTTTARISLPSNMSNGFYMLTVHSGGESVSTKIFVN